VDRDQEVETNDRPETAGSRGGGAVALSASRVTDSRLVSDQLGTGADGRASVRADTGAKGTQFILASWANLYAGLWLVIAPFALTYASYASKAHANEMIIGALVASMGATRVFGNYRSGALNRMISGLSVLPGIWLILAPFVLQYTARVRPTRVDIITGIVIIGLALWSYSTSRDDESADNSAR